VTGASS